MKQLQWRYCKACLMCFLLFVLPVFLFGCEKKPVLESFGIMTETEVVMEEMVMGSDDAGSNQQDLARPIAMGTSSCMLQVFVCGAVENPGVYLLAEGARIIEAIEAAGGFSQEADREWLNLAEPVSDGEKLKVYTLDETDAYTASDTFAGVSSFGSDQGSSGSGRIADDSRINLNTASKEELMLLPGIGESKAEAVIRYRQEHGGFSSTEEIMQISGIKNAVYLKIRDKITV